MLTILIIIAIINFLGLIILNVMFSSMMENLRYIKNVHHTLGILNDKVSINNIVDKLNEREENGSTAVRTN